MLNPLTNPDYPEYFNAQVAIKMKQITEIQNHLHIFVWFCEDRGKKLRY